VCERDRERVCVCMCVRGEIESVCMCVKERGRERCHLQLPQKVYHDASSSTLSYATL
jgi:hypothetical protein